ncbi:hypothetical protein FQZ97_920050 [compost metagenome]
MGEHRGHQGQQRQVQHGVERVGPGHGGHPGRQPQQGQATQKGATRRDQPRPGFDRGQQEAQDDRDRKAEQHFVRVPQQRRQRHGEVPLAQEQRHPEGDRQQRERRSPEVKRPESQPQQRPAQGLGRGGGLGRRGVQDGEGHGVVGVAGTVGALRRPYKKYVR